MKSGRTRRTRRTRLPALTALVVATALGGLAIMTASAGASNDGAEHASATLRDANGAVVGSADITEDGTGVVHVNVHVKGLSAGLHGIHVHNTASCTGAGFSGAGSHHNPGATAHGAHAGDLPNLTVNGAGVGRLNAVTNHMTLSAGSTTVFDTNGSALVVHALTDDLVTDPTGNSGARIACGIIEVH